MFETLEDLSPFKSHLNCSHFFHRASRTAGYCQFFSSAHSALSQVLAHKCSPEDRIVCVLIWKPCCEQTHHLAARVIERMCVRMCHMSAQPGDFINDAYAHESSSLNLTFRWVKIHLGFTHLHSHHVRLKAQSVSISLDASKNESVWLKITMLLCIK